MKKLVASAMLALGLVGCCVQVPAPPSEPDPVCCENEVPVTTTEPQIVCQALDCPPTPTNSDRRS